MISKMYTVIQVNVVTRQGSKSFRLHSQEVYKSLETLFVCFGGVSVK